MHLFYHWLDMGLTVYSNLLHDQFSIIIAALEFSNPVPHGILTAKH